MKLFNMPQILTTLVGLASLTTCLSSLFSYTGEAQLDQVVELPGLNFPTQFNFLAIWIFQILPKIFTIGMWNHKLNQKFLL